MREPIKAGDLAEVIDGLLGKDSPNIGLIVRVVQYVGDERTYGRIWRCEAEFGERIQPRPNIPAGLAKAIALRWLDLDDVGTEIGELEAEHVARHQPAQVDDANALERAGGIRVEADHSSITSSRCTVIRPADDMRRPA